MKVKTSELIDLALNWAVGVAEGRQPGAYKGVVRATAHPDYPDSAPMFGPELNYSTDWAQAGPIIEREAHNLFKHNGGTEWCCACNVPRDGYTAIVTADGPTPLIAAMRCLCCSKLGDVVDIPEELCQQQSS